MYRLKRVMALALAMSLWAANLGAGGARAARAAGFSDLAGHWAAAAVQAAVQAGLVNVTRTEPTGPMRL